MKIDFFFFQMVSFFFDGAWLYNYQLKKKQPKNPKKQLSLKKKEKKKYILKS